MADVALPAVELSLDRLEEQAEQLEADRAALEPSTLSVVFSYFGGTSSRAGESGSASGEAARAPWVSPEIFNADELMDVVKRGGTTPLSPDGSTFSPVSNSATSSERQFQSGADGSGQRNDARESNSTRGVTEGEHAGSEISVPGSHGRLPVSVNEGAAVASSAVGPATAVTEKVKEGTPSARLVDISEGGLTEALPDGDGTDGDELTI